MLQEQFLIGQINKCKKVFARTLHCNFEYDSHPVDDIIIFS